MFLEQGYSWGWMLDKYLQTGDTAVLHILNNYSYSIYEKMFEELRAYNESLDSNDKIKVIGIDVERFFGLAVRTLSYLLPDKDPPDEISLEVESLKGLAAYNDLYMEKYVDETDQSSSRYSQFSSENVLEEFFKNYHENKKFYIMVLFCIILLILSHPHQYMISINRS